jgi:hypothetical protein
MIIIVDSTEYRQDRGLNKEEFSLLREMGNKELIKLHIPWFVFKESSTTSISDARKDLSSIINTFQNSDKKGVHKNDVKKLKKIADEISIIEANLENSVGKVWEDFIAQSKAILYQFDKEDSIKVFDRYFTGDKPFKSLKNRDDIPDAFIFLTIQRIAISNEVHIVSNDKNLGRMCQEEGNVILYKSLKELYQSDDFKVLFTKYEALLEQKENFEKAKQIILSQKDVIENVAMNFVSSIEHLSFEDSSLISDNNDATILGFSFENLTILENEIKHIGEEIFIPIEIIGYALIEYFVYKADYWVRDDVPRFAEDWNDHYFLIEEELEMKITKTLNFKIIDVINDEEADNELDVDISDYDEIKILRSSESIKDS